MSERAEQTFESERLREFTVRVFVHCGVPEPDAAQAADVLATADLWGIDTHGVARLLAYYEMLTHERINPRPNVRILRQLPGTATLDGDNGLGLVVAPRANELALDKALHVGASWVGVCNSNHFGIAAYYSCKALAHDLIGWSMTNSTAQVAPLGGVGPMLGTNPISVAFPGLDEPPVVVDLATSAISYGKAETAIRLGESVPEGWMIDKSGYPATRPEQMHDGAALLPLGGTREHGGHKGFCLGAMVDILCGALSGANWGPFVPPFPYFLKMPARSVGKGLGHLFGAMRIDGFIEPDEFKRQIDDWVRVMRAAPPAPGSGGTVIPGDPERLAADERRRSGIPLSISVVEELRQLSKVTRVPFD